jgi:Family of unknown function (DUF6159)
MKSVMSTWRTLTAAATVMGRHWDCVLFPVSSCLVALVLTFTAVLPMFEVVLGIRESRPSTRLILSLAVYLAYGVLYLVVAFANVALVTGIAARLDGGCPGLTAGWGRASRRVGAIAGYALISATIGLAGYLTRLLVDPVFGTFVGPAIGSRLWERWRRISYRVSLMMAVPVIALDDPAPKNVLERADALVKGTWGERARPAHGLGTLSALLWLSFTALLATPFVRRGLVEHDPARVRLGLSAMLLATSTYIQFNAWVSSIVALAAYRYATSGRNDLFPEDPSFGELALLRGPSRTASSWPAWPHILKSFVVLDAADGRELLRIPLGNPSPVAAMVVPGQHGDVFVSTRPAPVRIDQE